MATAAATIDTSAPPRWAELRFFALTATIMAAIVAAGFSFQLGMGRSSFASPLRVHVHAIAFMGWVAIFLTQSWLAARGPLELHRKLGWIGAGWMALMLAAAAWVIVVMVRRGTVPFFFTPQQFIVGDPMMLLCFVGLTGSAIAMRRRTDWHSRLHICGMAALIGPAFGRLTPMPLFVPYAFEVSNLFGLSFVVAGMVRDRRQGRPVHRAWWVGVAAVLAALTLTDLIAYSPLGDRLYAAITAGSPGAQVPGLAFGTPPPSGLMTGR
jgi:hypothetical protein